MSTDTHFYVTGGSLRADAPSYVERRADRDLLEGLLGGEFCYVLTSRQMGKSSLMIRTARKLRNRGIGVIVLDLTAIGQNVTPEQWYDGLAVQAGRQLDMEDEVDDFWLHHTELGPCQRFFTILRDCMVARASAAPPPPEPTPEAGGSDSGEFTRFIVAGGAGPPRDPRLVVFVDEIDAVRSLSFSTDEFFAAIRECYNRRAQDSVFDRLTFCLLGVATPSDLVRDTRTTPFNIGRRIELHDFTLQEARPLTTGLAGHAAETETAHFRQDTRAQDLLERVLYWTNGHPYLTQRLCRAVAEAARQRSMALGPGVSADEVRPDVNTVDRICEDLYLSKAARSTNDNLLFVRDRLVRTDADPAAVLTLYRRVRKGIAGPDDAANPLANSLRLAGVVRPYVPELQVRNRIYQQVFDAAWVAEQMPDAELRRQKEAFRRGVVRTTAFGFVVLAVVVVLLLYALHQQRESNARSASLHAGNGVGRLERGDLLGALPSLVESLRLSAKGSADERIARIRLGCTLRQVPRLIQFWKYEGPLNGTALSDDGRFLITAGETNEAQIWDVTQGKLVGAARVDAKTVEAAEFNHSADRLLTLDADHHAQVWRIGGESPLSLMYEVTNVYTAAFVSDGRHVAVLEADGWLRIWDDDGKQSAALRWTNLAYALFADPARPRLAVVSVIQLMAGNKLDAVQVVDAGTLAIEGAPLFHSRRIPSTAAVSEVTFSPDGRWLATACTDNHAWLWDLQSRQPLRDAEGNSPFRHSTWVRTARFDSMSERLVTASYDGTARIWALRTGALLTSPLSHMHTVHEARFSRDGRLVVTASADNTAAVWDAKTGERAWAPVHHNAYVMNAWLTPDGNRLVSVGQDNSVRVAAAPHGLKFVKLGGGTSPAADLAFSADGRRLVTCGCDLVANVWDVSSGRLVRSWVEPKLGAKTECLGICAISPDGTLVAFWQWYDQLEQGKQKWNGRLRIHGVDDGSAVNVEVQGERQIAALEFEPREGRRLMLATIVSQRGASAKQGAEEAPDRGIVEVLDARTGTVLNRIDTGTTSISTARFSPDGRLIATGASDGLVRVFTSDGARSWSYTAPQGVPVVDVAFSPDGTRVVFACSDQSFKSRAAYIWNFQTKETPLALPHSDGVLVVRVSPDGRRVATASEDGTSRLWDLDTGLPVAQVVRHRYHVIKVAFDPENRVLLSAGQYGDVKLLDVRTAEPLALPLQFEGAMSALEFNPKGRVFGTATGRGDRGDLRLWFLPEEGRSVEELKALSELLSGNYIHPTAGLTQVRDEDVEHLWQKLRGRYPELTPEPTP